MSVKIFRDPFIQFLLLGSLVFTVFSLVADSADSDKKLTVSTADIVRLYGQWSTQYSKPPTQEQLESIIDQHIRDEIFYREAKKLNLGEDDIIIRRRMVQKYIFLSDSMAEIDEPSEQVLADFYLDNKQRYTIPETFSFRHIYYAHVASSNAPDRKRDNAAEAAAGRMAQRLNDSQISAASWRKQGDVFMLQREYAARERSQVAELFGAEFADTLAGFSDNGLNRWVAPVRSAYGWHAVQLLQRIPAATPVLADIRSDVLADFFEEQRQQANIDYYQSIRDQYDVTIDTGPDLPRAEISQ